MKSECERVGVENEKLMECIDLTISSAVAMMSEKESRLFEREKIRQKAITLLP